MTSINIDTFLKIGSQHKVCEDYILAGMEPTPHIILADGCSSSNNTEMGARILCYMARQFLKLKGVTSYKCMEDWIIISSELAARQLGLTPISLDATLIVSYFDMHKRHINVRFYGDGCLIVVDQDDNISYTEISFSNNAPYYLSYRLNTARQDEYHENKLDLILSRTEWSKSSQSEVFKNVTKFAYDTPIEISNHIDSCKLLMICSDGITSFYNGHSRLEPPLSYTEDVIRKLISFKSKAGLFLQRRASKAIQGYKKADIVHADDLSIGAYLIEEI